MLFDTDVIIWALRGNRHASDTIYKADNPCVSVVSYMELLMGARDKKDSQTIRAFLASLGFRTLPLTENIGHRAAIYLEEYALMCRIGVQDSLIAATAVENEIPLCSGNAKHFKPINDINLKLFRP
ncbi:MAG: type II toxin-antitoxin system VapC family toxin [Candidatus Hydrogenedens sp.]|nr:type II toxin-antitoxin system VapC family toxin [Candidatus Hydrogenedentota bacterium]NLF57288.1 type II toxin-antitoxin system VapC family toxin [Candidatus Hydrogenedens sp.]